MSIFDKVKTNLVFSAFLSATLLGLLGCDEGKYYGDKVHVSFNSSKVVTDKDGIEDKVNAGLKAHDLTDGDRITIP